MAWTAPRTFVTGETVTSAIMNTHVRDNLLETASATAAAAGDLVYADAANSMGSRLAHPGQSRYLVSDAANGLAWRQPQEDVNYDDGATLEVWSNVAYSPTSAAVGGSFRTLPSVTVTTGTLAKVTVSCQSATNDTTGSQVYIAFKITGATTLDASDALAANGTNDANQPFVLIRTRLIGLTAGSNTFQMMAKVGSGTGSIFRPSILVDPY